MDWYLAYSELALVSSPLSPPHGPLRVVVISLSYDPNTLLNVIRQDDMLDRCKRKRKRKSLGIEVVLRPTLIYISVPICDMIKRNESDVGDIDFEILAKTVFKFFCFTLFLASTNCSTSDSFLFFNKCLISLDRVTYRYRYFKLKPVQIITRG